MLTSVDMEQPPHLRPLDAVQWRRVKGILHQALALSPAERSVYLEVVCGADAGLRASVVR